MKAVLDGGFPEASFQATLHACARRLPTPVIYLEAALNYKKEVQKRIKDETPSLFGKEEPPEGQLRAVKVVPNDPAHKEKFVIPTNMRVPEVSVIRRLFVDESASDDASREDLCWWESQGKRLDGRAIAVEARRVSDRVIAIVQPIEPVRQKPQRPKVKTLFEE